jgi:histidinol-phosphatase (PHP family)
LSVPIIRKNVTYKTDYHNHTLFSDGKAGPEESFAAASAAGLKEIGFSEHLNLFVPGQRWCMDQEITPEYISVLKKLRRIQKIPAIRIGLEVDYFPGKDKEIGDFINMFDLDYVIGSVHYMGDTTVDSGPEFYSGKSFDEIFINYFAMVTQAVESGLFDIIGHCDLVRIFGYVPSFDPEPLYRELASSMALHDVAFELNTNGRNRPLGDFYPDRRFLHIFREKNVPVCVNSDSHFPARVAQHFNEAYALLRNAGYSEMCAFKKRERYAVPADFSDI